MGHNTCLHNTAKWGKRRGLVTWSGVFHMFTSKPTNLAKIAFPILFTLHFTLIEFFAFLKKSSSTYIIYYLFRTNGPIAPYQTLGGKVLYVQKRGV